MNFEFNPTYVMRGFLGIFILLAIAWLLSFNRKKISWKLVGSGMLLQFVFAFLILTTPQGRIVFEKFNGVIIKLLSFSDEGAGFVFGNLINNFEIGAIFAFKVLPTIIFFSSMISVLYYLGVMQKVVEAFAWVMVKILGTSGAETLSCSANIFVGQTEAPLLIKPFVEKMTKSELMTVMTGGFATVAGGVMAAYVGMLVSTFPEIAGHLLSASIMNAPAAIYLSKVILPEEEEPVTKGKVAADLPIEESNFVDAAANGAGQGLHLALNVGAMLMAFIALIAIVNFALKGILGIVLGSPAFNPGKLALYKFLVLIFLGFLFSYALRSDKIFEKYGGMFKANRVHTSYILGFLLSFLIVIPLHFIGIKYANVISYDNLGLSQLFGWIFSPIAWAIGVSWKDSTVIGSLLGTRMAINEFVAYANLAEILQKGTELEPRSIMLVTYALCGFANFSSIGIQIGGIGGIAPSRRADLAKLGFHAVIAGTLATFMSATIAGMIASEPRLSIKKNDAVIEAPAPQSNLNRDFYRYASSQTGISEAGIKEIITVKMP
jgi:concentrative nucleoside transporter, CNT family